MTRRLMAILALIVIIGVALRLLMLALAPAQIFFEPDNFYYFAVMKETIANNGLIPSQLPLSGFPVHTSYQEFPGLIYITLIPYWLMGGIVPLIWVMYAMPLVFGILGIIVTYLLAKRFFKKESAALAAAAFYAIIPAAVYRTTAMQYRGESFVPVLLAIFVLGQVSANRNYRLASWVLVPIMLVTWKAGAYVIPVIAIAFLLMLIEKRRARERALVMAAIFVVVLITAYFALAVFEWSPNIEEAILEAQPATPGYAFLTLNLMLILAPLGWIATFLEKGKKKDYLILWAWLTATLLVMVPFFVLQLRWVFLIPIPMAVFGGLGLDIIYRGLKKTRIPPRLLLAIVIAFSYSFSLTYLYAQSGYSIIYEVPVVDAAAWISSNTAHNSTFLSYWGDSSIIEGWGNRTTYTESTNANGTRINAYARFILAQNGNYSYIEAIKPDYLFVSNSTGARVLAEEANLTGSLINPNNTNLYHLAHDNVTLPLVYSYNGVEIYNVTSLWER